MMSDSQFSQDTDDDDFGGYIKIDRYNQDRIDSLKENYHNVLKQIGEEPEREGLLKTPERVAKAMLYLTHGYDLNAEEILNSAKFREDYSQMVVVKDIEVYSMCEHHMLPFFGKMHVAYLPNNKVIGLSKIPRLVDVFARRLQIQERLTQEVVEVIPTLIEPRGVAVVCEARHFCMMMRGVEKQHSGAVTSAMLGAFRDNRETRSEVLSLIGRGSIAV